jgi:hypothetical protein
MAAVKGAQGSRKGQSEAKNELAWKNKLFEFNVLIECWVKSYPPPPPLAENGADFNAAWTDTWKIPDDLIYRSSCLRKRRSM